MYILPYGPGRNDKALNGRSIICIDECLVICNKWVDWQIIGRLITDHSSQILHVS